MTPYEIDILLFYYARCEDHPDIVRNPPGWRVTVKSLIEQDLLTREERTEWNLAFRLTDRGTAYVDALQRVPLPRAAWLVPDVDLNDWVKEALRRG